MPTGSTVEKVLINLVPGSGQVRKAAARTAAGAYPASTKEAELTKLAKATLKASNKVGVNPVVLWGILGNETGFGSDLKASSTGAQGPFQFEPATAKEYGYPYSANLTGRITNIKVFEEQAEAAGRLIKANLKNKANPSNAELQGAIAAYKGGTTNTYNLPQVLTSGKTISQWLGSQYANEEQTRETNTDTGKEAEPETSLLKELEGYGLTLTLVLAGLALIVYGVITMLRPGAATNNPVAVVAA